MKLSKSLVLGVILLFVLAIGAYGLFARPGQSNFRSESGFRGLKWGAPISEHEYAKPSDFSKVNKSKDFIEYKISGEKNYLGDIYVSHIFYSFLVNNGVERFESVEIELHYLIAFDTEKLKEEVARKVLDVLTKEYGKYTEERDSAINKKYTFENDYVTVYFRPQHDDPSTSRGRIIISSKEMRSRYLKIYEEAEEAEMKKAEEEARIKARRQADF